MKKTLKILSTILAIVLVFGTVSVGMSAYAASDDIIGDYDFTITNPYKDITWGNVTAYKSETHVHTVRSDADTEVNDMIYKYYELGYDAMCLTDHGTVNYGWNKAQTRVTIFDYQFFVHGEADELSNSQYKSVITGTRSRAINSGKGMMDIPLGNEMNGMSTIKCHINNYYADAAHGDLGTTEDWPTNAVVKSYNAGGMSRINHVGEWTDGNGDPEVYDSSWVRDFASIYSNYCPNRGGRGSATQTTWMNNHNGMAGCIGMELVNTADSRTHNDRRYVYDEILKILAPQGINVYGFCEDDAHEYSDCDRNAQYFLINNDKDTVITSALFDASNSSGDDNTSDYNNNNSDPMDRVQNYYRDAMFYGEFYACSKNSKNSYELGDGFVASGAYPSVSNISVDQSKSQISITYKDATKLRVIADGNIIETHRSDASQQTVVIDLNRNETKINSYIRIFLTGAGGITYLQPFLVTKTQNDQSTVQFVTPSSDTSITVKDSNGSVVSDSLRYDNNYFVLPAGEYTYTASRRGYETKENVPFTVTNEDIANHTQKKINVTLDELSDVSYAYFYAPETIYVNPSDNKTFQKYIDRDNAVNGALHAEPQSTGNVYFHREEASNMNLSWTVIDGNTTLDSMTVGATTAAGDTLATSITYGKLTEALQNDQYVYIKWTLTYTYNNLTYTAYQYSYVYKPLNDIYHTVAAGGAAKTNKGGSWLHTTMIVQATIYVTGVHRLDSSYYQGYKFYPASGLNPYLGGVDNYRNEITSGVGYRYETDISDGAGSCVAKSDNTDAAYLYADRSRVNNWSEFPYFGLGLDIGSTEEATGDGGDTECVRFAFDASMTELETFNSSFEYLYLAEFASGNDLYYRGISYNLDGGMDSVTTVNASNGIESLQGRIYYVDNEEDGKNLNKQLPSADIQEETVDVSAYLLGSKEGRTDKVQLGVHIHLVNINKSSLRTEFNNTVKGCFQQEWFQSIDEWNAYQNVIANAGKVLGNPTSEEADIEEATLELQSIVDNFNLKTGQQTVEHRWKYNGGEGLIYANPTYTYHYGDDLSANAMEIAGYTYANEYSLSIENSLEYTYANGYKTYAESGAREATDEDTYDLAFAEKSSYAWKFYYTPNQYSVTYNSMGAGAVTGSTSAIFGQDYVVSADVPVKPGYTFNGWYLDNTQRLYSAGETFKWNYAGDGEFTAQWTAKTYNVTYDVNGGNTLSVGNAYKTAVYGDSYPICPNIPTKTGYDFTGWKLNGGDVYTAGSQVFWDFTTDSTFVAQWEIADYDVDFDVVEDDATPINETISVRYNEPYGTLPTAVRTGYTSQWYSDPNYPSNAYVESGTNVKIAADHTLFAKYTPIDYNITYNLEGGTITISNPSVYNIESGNITLNNPIKTGYDFIGWSGSDISSAAYEVTHVITTGSTGDKTFTAHWELSGYNINYVLNGGTNDAKNVASYKVTDEVTIYAPTRLGYRFLGWTGSNGTTPETSVTIAQGSTGEKTYTANWELVTYNITYNYDGATTVPSNPTTYNANTATFTLIEPERVGYIFNGWDSNVSGFDGASVTIEQGTISGDLTFKALWREAAAHNVSYVLNGGRVEGSNPDSYKTPQTFNIVKPVKDGYTFKNWTKKVGGGAVQTLADGADATIDSTDNGDIVFTAYWTIVDYSISYDHAGGKIVANATNPTTYNFESSAITLVNPIKPGYDFGGWTGTGLTRADKNVVISTGSYGNRTYTATWNPLTYTVTYDFNGGADTGLIRSYTTLTSASIGAPVRTGYSFAGWNINYTSLSWTEGTINNSGKFITQAGSYYSSPVTMKNGYTYTINSAASGLKFCVFSTDGTSMITKTSTGTYTATSDCVAFVIAESQTLSNIRTAEIAISNSGDDTFDTYAISLGSAGNLSLVANWDNVTYTISYELDGGSFAGGTNPNPASYTYNSAAIRLVNPEKRGCEFLGWSYNGTVSTSVTIANHSTGDRTYVATWGTASYTVTYRGLEGANVSGNPATYTVSDSFTLNRPTKNYYTFNGWVGTGLTGSTLDVTVPANSVGNREYTATWSPNTYRITYVLNGGTNNSSNPNSFTVETNTFSLAAPTKTGSIFAGWTGTGIEGSSANVTIAKGSYGDREYTATWNINTFNISYDLAGGTEGTNPTSYTANDTITLAHPTRSGYDFTGWTETSNSQLTLNVTIPAGSTGDKNYLAHWQVDTYTISYTLDGGQISDNAKRSYTVETATFNLETPVKAGYRFAGWTGTGLDAATTSVTISKGSTGNRAYTATWVEDSFTITYTNVDYDDVTFAAENRTSYTAITNDFTLNNPTRSGYNFTGWTGTGISGEGISTTVTIPKGSTGNRTYRANWAIAEYTITYELNGGTEVLPNPTTYTYFSAPITLNNPVKSGYVFDGWQSDYFDETLETVVIGNHSSGNKTFFATWGAGNYTITLDPDGGTLPAGQSASFGYTYTTPTFTIQNPTKDGYTFIGWSGTGITGTKLTIEIPINSTGNRSYVANWSAAANVLTYDLDGGQVTKGTNPGSYDTNSGTLTIINPTKDGYKFNGWSYDSSNTFVTVNSFNKSAKIDTSVGGSVAFTATWVPLNYKISYNLNGGEISGNRTTYTIEDTFTIPAPTRSGYSFAGWSGTGLDYNSENITIVNGTGNRTYTANWSETTYTITYNYNGGSVDVSNPINYTVLTPSFTLNNPSKTGCTFTGWSGTGLASSSTVVTISTGSTGNRIYTANFEPIQYKITYVGVEDSSFDAATSKKTYTSTEADFSIPNLTKSGYTFLGWKTEDSVNPVKNLVIRTGASGDKTFTAMWTLISYTVTYELNGGTVNGDNPTTYNVNTPSITLINPTKTGYETLGWSTTAGGTPSLTAEITHGSTGNKTFYAQYGAKINTITYLEVDYEDCTFVNNHPTYVTGTSFYLDTPSRPGYEFLGWTGTGLTQPQKAVQVLSTDAGNRTYTANWSLSEYTIHVDYAGGSSTTDVPVTYNVTSAKITLPTPKKTGFVFVGWSGTGIASGETAATVEIPRGSVGNRTYTAVWTDRTDTKHRIYFYGYKDNLLILPSGLTYEEVEIGQPIPDPIDDVQDTVGYKIKSWNIDLTDSKYVNLNDDIEVHSTWAVSDDIYTVTVNGTASSTTKCGQYEKFTAKTDATSKSGAKFSHWVAVKTDSQGNELSREIVSYYQNYTFYVHADIYLLAVYGSSSSVRAASRVSYVEDYDRSYDWFTVYTERNIATEYTLVQHGVIFTDDSTIGAKDTNTFTVTDSQHASYVSSNSFVIGTTGVKKGVSTVDGLTGMWTLSIRNPAKYGSTIYIRSFVKIADVNGNITTVYGNVETYQNHESTKA